jgi:uncharacterized protein with FMN-binding domain
MRRGVVRTMSVVTLAVMGLGLRAGAQPAGTPSSSSTRSSTSTPAGRPRHVGVRPSPTPTAAPRLPAGTPSPRTSAAPKQPGPTAASVSYQGDVVDTEYGPVRVRITVQHGRIKRAQAIEHPQGDGTTDEINAYAVPALDQEAVGAQSAHIDAVSGATFTSEGYRQSLQSALDAAHQAGAL